jgi:hypothetical protein
MVRLLIKRREQALGRVSRRRYFEQQRSIVKAHD